MPGRGNGECDSPGASMCPAGLSNSEASVAEQREPQGSGMEYRAVVWGWRRGDPAGSCKLL